MAETTPGYLRFAVILGLVSAIGPFAIDMYLPSLPSIGGSLSASPRAVQFTLLAFFVALAMGQVVYGPVSDRFGRKRPLYAGLALFAASSVGCAFAPDIGTLIVFRFLEGIGACAGMVIPRAVVRDLHTGVAAARLMSLLMLVFSISPILAPLAGSGIIALAPWRAVFWVVTAAALLGIVMIAVFLPETRPPAARREASVREVVRTYATLLHDRRFIAISLIGGFGMASFFAYLANSPFVLIQHFHLTPTLYGVFFGINAASFFATAQFTAWLGGRYGLRRVVRAAVAVHAAAMLSLFALTVLGCDRLDVLAALLFVGFGSLGLVVPSTAVLALEAHGPIAGTASALLGTLQFLAGGAVMVTGSMFVDGTPLPMVAAIAMCSAVSLALAQGTLGRARRSPAPVAVG